MNILSRYILRECFLYFLLSLCAFSGILLTVQMLRFSELIINRGVQASQIALVFASITPTFLELAIPMSALLGVLLAISRLSGDSEIIILRASGISIRYLTKPILIFASTIFVLALVVSTICKPWGNLTLNATLFEIARSRSTAGIESGIFNRLGEMTLYAEEISYADGSLKKVLIDDRRSGQRKVVVAEKGKIESDDTSRTIIITLQDGSIHEEIEDKYLLTHFNTNVVSFRSDELFGDAVDKEISPKAMWLGQIRKDLPKVKEAIDYLKTLPQDPIPTAKLNSGEEFTLKDLQKRSRRMQLELGNRIAIPFAALLLPLVALPLGIMPPRTHKTWGPSVAFTLGLIVFVVYFALLSVGMTMVEAGKLSPILSGWIPNVIVLLVALRLMHLVSSEKVASISGALEDRLRLIFSKIRRFKVHKAEVAS